MKYIKPKALLIILVCLCLVGCASADQRSSAELVDSAISGCEALSGSYTVYTSSAGEGEDGFLSDEDFYALYHSESEPANELTLLCDWCIALGTSKDPGELHVLKVVNKSDREAIAEMLGRRAKRLKLPELFHAGSDFLYDRPTGTEVFTCGSFVIMCAANDTASVVEFFK